MVLTLLGNNPVNIEDGWVPYTAIGLRRARTYLLEVQIDSASPDLLFSSFRIKFSYPTTNTLNCDHVLPYKIYYQPNIEAVEIVISPNLINQDDAIFYVRRFSFYSQPTILADCTVELNLDPNVFY